MANFYSIAPFIQQYYPQYYSIETYPADKCAAFSKVDEPWGVLGNFGRTPITIDGVVFKKSEQLFQLMKFRDEEPLLAVYKSGQSKMTAKHWEKTHRRNDWGQMIVDAMKYCLCQKWNQSEEFRNTLMQTQGRYIVEDQTTFPKKEPDTWGVKRREDVFVGPNLMGRLLMELRDGNGMLEYHLPDDALDFVGVIKGNLADV